MAKKKRKKHRHPLFFFRLPPGRQPSPRQMLPGGGATQPPPVKVHPQVHQRAPRRAGGSIPFNIWQQVIPHYFWPEVDFYFSEVSCLLLLFFFWQKPILTPPLENFHFPSKNAVFLLFFAVFWCFFVIFVVFCPFFIGFSSCTASYIASYPHYCTFSYYNEDSFRTFSGPREDKKRFPRGKHQEKNRIPRRQKKDSTMVKPQKRIGAAAKKLHICHLRHFLFSGYTLIPPFYPFKQRDKRSRAGSSIIEKRWTLKPSRKNTKGILTP